MIGGRVRSGISQIQPYVPGLTDDELKHQYGLSQVVKLNSNENALGPSSKALEAIREELSTLHHYPEGASTLLRDALAAFHSVTSAQVFVGNGSDDIIKLLSETFLDQGDEVVVPFPSFSQYGFGAQVMRAGIVPVSLNADFSYDVEALLSAVTPATKLLYVCSPNNPTGTIMTAAEADWLMERLPEHVIVVMDLAYNDYSIRNDRVIETQKLLADPRVVFLHTFSKLYGLAGIRVGYALANPEIWQYVHRVREPFNVNRLAQRAAVAALSDEAHRQASIALAEQGRVFFASLANELGLYAPDAEGNFVLLSTGDGPATTKALMQRGVMVRSNYEGLPEFIRVTFGTETENEICGAVLREVVRR